MALIEVNWNPSERDLAWFGLGTGALLGLAGALLYAKVDPVAGIAVGSLAAGGTALYFGVRALRRPMYTAWMRLIHPLGWLLSHALFALVYFLVITPIGLAMRAAGRDPMQRRREPERESYWIARKPSGDVRRYFRQY